jgi:hypothetical protein
VTNAQSASFHHPFLVGVGQMNILEKPIQWGNVVSITKLPGGINGRVYLFKNDANEKLVVKLQNEAPKFALAGTYVMEKAKVSTPEIRVATDIEIADVNQIFQKKEIKIEGHYVAAKMSTATATKKMNAKGVFKYLLVMEFAEGNTLKSYYENNPKNFLKVMCDPKFQIELGKILAADEFAGNADRMFATLNLSNHNIESWHNPGNLFIHNGKPVAIDNGFSLDRVSEDTLPFGKNDGNKARCGSIASAFHISAEQEAGALFDTFIAKALEKFQNDKDLIEYVKNDVEPHRKEFMEHVSGSATSTMRKLLAHGQGWKKELIENGVAPTIKTEADESCQDPFLFRKRILRMVANGENPEDSYKIANDNIAYHKWVLTKELKLDGEAADELLKKGSAEYKKFKNKMLNKFPLYLAVATGALFAVALGIAVTRSK